MTYPLYWTQESNTFWLETGGPIVNATLAVRDNIVEFAFYDGSRRHSSRREFPNLKRARNFAVKFGRLMRKLDQRNAVPVPATFDEF